MNPSVAVTLVVVVVACLFCFEEGEAAKLTKCELAKKLKLSGAPNYAEWVCIADVNTYGQFNTDNQKGDTYGLWEISAREFCKDKVYTSSPNKCGFDCERFLDGFFTDDIRCLKEIHADRGFFGFPGWFRRFTKCANIDTYLQECNL